MEVIKHLNTTTCNVFYYVLYQLFNGSQYFFYGWMQLLIHRPKSTEDGIIVFYVFKNFSDIVHILLTIFIVIITVIITISAQVCKWIKNCLMLH